MSQLCIFVLFPRGGFCRPEIYVMCLSICKKSLPVTSVKMANTWRAVFSFLWVKEEKQALEFLSDTFTSPSDFPWDLGMNVYRRSQKCPLSLCISYFDRYPTWDLWDLTFRDSKLCWYNCHWNSFRSSEKVSLAVSYFALKIKECFENPGGNWLILLSPVSTNWIYYLHVSVETWGLINVCKTLALKKRSLFSYDFKNLASSR